MATVSSAAGDGLLCVDGLRLPVSVGAAGALGATYCSPYVVDGAYHARPSRQTSETGASSQENNLNKTNKEWKPSQRLEPGKDEFGQRQNKPRRQVGILVFGAKQVFATSTLILEDELWPVKYIDTMEQAFLQALCDP